MVKLNGKHPEKHSEVLNLNEGMVNSLIKKLERDIIEYKQEQAKIKPDLDVAYAQYLEYKKPYDELQAKVEEEENTLKVLIGFKRNENDRKRIVVLKTKSNSEQKDKRSRDYSRMSYRWLDRMIDILQQEQSFLSFDTLFRKVRETFPDYGIAEKTLTKPLATIKAAQLCSMRNSCDPKITKKPRVSQYNGKYGLIEWMDATGSPFPKYLKGVMGTADTTTRILQEELENA